MIGGVLEALLQAAGYSARFLSEPVVDRLVELLADSQLLVFAPTLSAERRKTLLDMMLGPALSVKIPVVELLPADEGEQHPHVEHIVLWPCSMEELKRAIDDALLAQR